MMLYEEENLKNLLLNKTAEKWHSDKTISDSEYSYLLDRYTTSYKVSNVVYRFGLFLLTVFMMLSAIGFFALFSQFLSSRASIIIQSFIWSGIYYFALRHFVLTQNQYKSGITEALAYGAIGAFYTGTYLILDSITEQDILSGFILALPIFILASIYMVDSFLFVVSYCVIIGIVFLSMLKIETWGQLLLPFMLMLFTAVSYPLLTKCTAFKKWWMYISSINVLQKLSLFLFYASGNYFVVRELSNELNPSASGISNEIAFSWFFKLFTLVVPLVYIYWGLKNKSKTFFQLGALLLVAGIVSLKYYYSVMAIEYSLTLAGALCVGFCYWLSSYLKSPKNGISLSPTPSKNKRGWQQLGASILAHQLSPSEPIENSTTEFKGGNFGGGGAGGTY